MIKFLTFILTIFSVLPNIEMSKQVITPTYDYSYQYYEEVTEPTFNPEYYICTTPTGRAIYVGEQFGLSLPEGYPLPEGVEMWDANEDYYGDFMEE